MKERQLREQALRRIEEASQNAWPAMQQMLVDGWLLRFSRGFTKRSNSIVPLYVADEEPNLDSLTEKIRYCENLYARAQLQTVFRLTSILNPHNAVLDEVLADRGYARVETNQVLTVDLTTTQIPPHAVRSADLLNLEGWLAEYCSLTGMAEPSKSLHRLILNAIAGDATYAVAVTRDQQTTACALAVAEHDVVGLFDVFTHPDHRREGWGRGLVGWLLTQAGQQGIPLGYLQVVQDNHPAIDLYQGLGFTEGYQYWYRVAP